MIKESEYKILPVRSFVGLELEMEKQSRPVNSWQRLENFDLFVTGAIRRIKGLQQIIDKKYDSPIISIKQYRRTPDEALINIGLAIDGQLYNIETGELLTQFPVVNYAFDGQMPGVDEGRSSDDINGQSDGIKINYFITTAAGFFNQKWNGISGTTPTPIGIDPPTAPLWVIPNYTVPGTQSINPDLPGNPSLTVTQTINLLVSRTYQVTLWNPLTRHESSPSLLLTTIPSLANPTINAADIPTGQEISFVKLFPFPWAIEGDAINEAIARGYTRLRFYATRDGGTEFFLCTNIVWYDSQGYGYLSDMDNSVPFAGTGRGFNNDMPYTDGYGGDPLIINPLDVLPFTRPTNTFPPTPEPQLVQPAPLIGENDPPEPAIWGAVYQGRLWFVPSGQLSRIVFSKTGDFQSFPIDNFIDIPADEFSPITAIDGEFQQLVIGKIHATARLIGSDLTDFVLTPLDPEIGFSGRRSVGHLEGVMYFLSQVGLMEWSGDKPDFYGRSIAPLIDLIPENVKLERILIGVDSADGLVLVSTISEDNKFGIIIANSPLRDPEQEVTIRPFSLMTGINYEVTAFGEVTLEDGDVHSLVALQDCRVYKLFENPNWVGGLATTQPLPQDDPYSRKVFHILRTTNFVEGFSYEVLVDGKFFYKARPLKAYNYLGVVGKQIEITFKHDQPWTQQPVLSNYTIEYSLIGEAQ